MSTVRGMRCSSAAMWPALGRMMLGHWHRVVARRGFAATMCRLTPHTSRLSPPRLPPPPPLTGGLPPPRSALALPWQTPQAVLATFVEYVPTFFVPVESVAALLPEEICRHVTGRGRLLSLFRRYPFLFECRQLEASLRHEVRLRGDANHPRRGAADDKYAMVDVGELTSYAAKVEHIRNTDLQDQNRVSVALTPATPPPAVCVALEERVPVLERLVALIPDAFRPIEAVEQTLPDDILFHPYFDSQGGLAAIANKFPEHFQVVDGAIRLRRPYLAPLALDEYTLANSPLPEIAALVRREVCRSDIPYWVRLTTLYEQLTREQKRAMKRQFRSFASFLRAHGRSLSVSPDMLQVAMWISPVREGESPPSTTASSHTPPTPLQIINELYDRLSPATALTPREACALLPPEMQLGCTPTQLLQWVDQHEGYFFFEGGPEQDKVRLRRTADRRPSSLAQPRTTDT